VAVAVAEALSCSLIQPLAWELLYATGVALKRKKEKKKRHPWSSNCGTVG